MVTTRVFSGNSMNAKRETMRFHVYFPMSYLIFKEFQKIEKFLRLFKKLKYSPKTHSFQTVRHNIEFRQLYRDK